MGLKERILAEHSKANCDRITKWVGDSQTRFDELFNLFLGDDNKVSQWAAWPVSYAVIAHPGLIKKHLATLIKNLEKPGLHDSVKRNSVRLLQHISIPERLRGGLMDTCFRYISAPDEAVAIKAFSLTILENLAKQYP